MQIWNLGTGRNISPTKSYIFGQPLAHALYTPIGKGMMAFSSSRLNKNMHMFSLNESPSDSEVHVFEGNAEPFKRMAFRVNEESNKFQLCTLSIDNTLRLWHPPNSALQGIYFIHFFIIKISY